MRLLRLPAARAYAALPILSMLSFLIPTASFAVDGVIEINQVCAVETGCTPSDDPGFPVSLDAEGSYRLTSSLENLDPATDVLFLGNGVQLDLNGFTVFGGRNGINDTLGLLSFPGHVIRNGFVEDAALAGIRSSGKAIVENVIARGNGDVGIFVGADSRVTGCVAEDNQGGGIGADANAIIENNVVTGNALVGIQVNPGPGVSQVRNNTLAGNPDLGISVPGGSVLSGNVVSGSEFGIQAGDGVSMSGDRVTGSGLDGITCGGGCDLSGVASSGNGLSGIVLGDGANLRDCVVQGNSDDGIQLASGSRVSGCTVGGNGDDGVQVAGAAGVVLIGNTVSGNEFGLFLDATTAFGDNSVNDSATADLFGATGLPIGCNAVGGVVSCP